MNSGVSRCSPVGCNDSALQLLRFQIAVPKIPEMHTVSHVITEQVLHRKSVQGPFSKHRVAGRRLRLHQMRGRTLDTCFTALLYCQTHTPKKQTCQKREREREIYKAKNRRPHPSTYPPCPTPRYPLGVEASTDGVEVQLADGNAHPPGPQVAQTQDTTTI